MQTIRTFSFSKNLYTLQAIETMCLHDLPGIAPGLDVIVSKRGHIFFKVTL